jgi:hypothetical protein
MSDADDKRKKQKVKDSMIDRTSIRAATSGKPPVFDMIGRRLRDYYDDVAKQPVPDRFVELLKQLESKTGKKDQ